MHGCLHQRFGFLMTPRRSQCHFDGESMRDTIHDEGSGRRRNGGYDTSFGQMARDRLNLNLTKILYVTLHLVPDRLAAHGHRTELEQRRRHAVAKLKYHSKRFIALQFPFHPLVKLFDGTSHHGDEEIFDRTKVVMYDLALKSQFPRQTTRSHGSATLFAYETCRQTNELRASL